MSPPPPRPDDEQPPAEGWEVVEPARDPLLDDPLFAELVEDKPLPELKVEPPAPPLPVAEPVDDLPVAEVVAVPRATPVERPRPRPVAPPAAKRSEEPVGAPRPRWVAACSVLGCFGLGFVSAMAFIGWAALTLLSGISDDRRPDGVVASGTRPGPVGPTQFAGPNRVVPLPGRVDAVGRAAGGRYLLMRVPQKREILAFDPNVGDLLPHRFECGTQGLFAGSASKLFVYRPDATGEELQRWDLTTGVREKAVAKPRDVLAPTALVVGAGVDGPVYLVITPSGGSAAVRAFDPDTLELLEAPAVSGWLSAPNTHVRPSDDGTVWGVTARDGALLVRFPTPPAKGVPTALPLPRRATVPPVLATPSRDGKLAFTPFGVVDVNLTPPRKHGTRSLYTFPAAHGSGLFLSLEHDLTTKTLDGPLRLHVSADPDFGADIDTVDVPRGLQSGDAGNPPPDQRVHIWPAAGIAAVIPSPLGAAGVPDQQVLDVRRVDVRPILNEREDSFLVFGSEPQLWAVRGREWRYRPAVWTKDKPIPTPTKAEGPAAMSVQNGEVVWTPGRNDTRADVKLRVSSGDLVAEQRFRVTVVDEPDDDQ